MKIVRWNPFHNASIALAFFILIVSSPEINAQWMDISSARNDIAFAGNLGFIVGNNGTILKSTDNGKNWVNMPNILGSHFEAEYVKLSADGQNIKVIANMYFDGLTPRSCSIIESKDGGKTWKEIFSRYGLIKGFFLNDSVGYVYNTSAYSSWHIMKTTNGGASWNEDKRFLSLIALNFYDDLHGWALVNYSSSSHDYAIAKTQDGGNTWQRSFSINSLVEYTAPLGILTVVDENNAIYSSYPSSTRTVTKTSDGGMTWTPICLKLNPNQNGCLEISSVQMIDSKRGWMYDQADNLLFETTDGWNTSSLVPVINVNKVWMKDNHGFLIGLSGLIAETNDNGLTWRTKNQWGLESFFQTLPINDILVRDSCTWAVGDSQVLQSDSNVKEWNNKIAKWPGYGLGYSLKASGIAFFNEQGCIVGDGMGINLTTDNGKTWSLRDNFWNGQASPLPSVNDFTFEDMKVYMPDKNTIWLSGENGFVLKSTDFGKKFTASKSWSGFMPSGRVRLAFLKPDRIVAYYTDVSYKAEISDDNGASWKVTEEAIASVDFLNEDVGWKLLWNNDLYKTSDGGLTWELIRNMDFTPYLSLNRVKMSFVDEKAGWLLESSFNKLFFTNDEGKTWVEENIGVNYPIDQLKFHAYSSGDIVGLAAGTGALKYVGSYMPYKKESQTIVFDSIASKKYNDPKFELKASSSSGLPITFTSSDLSVATISNTTVTITGAGTTILSASQKGNIDYLPAKVSHLFRVGKAEQVISFDSISDKVIDAEKFDVKASTSSGLSVRFESLSDKISLNKNQVTLLKTGRSSITAVQEGNNNYNPAPSISRSFCINFTKPLITIKESTKDFVTLLSNYSAGNQWFFNSKEIPGATNSEYKATDNGVYSLKIRVDDCLSESSEIVPVITDVTNTILQVDVFPNPILSGYLTVRLGDNQDKKEVFIYHVDGKVVDYHETFEDSSQFDVSGYASGLYVIKIVTLNRVDVVKLLKL